MKCLLVSLALLALSIKVLLTAENMELLEMVLLVLLNALSVWQSLRMVRIGSKPS